jgi:hypothetical protein
MFGNAYFEPWIGDQYRNGEPRLLVIGESRYHEEFTDKQIIQERVEGNRHRTFTNFVQAALGTRYWEPDYDESGFWSRVLFYNYNTTFFPGGARLPLPWNERMSGQNARLLLEVLREWKPSHAVTWGMANWDSLSVEGTEWTGMEPIPGATAEPYCSVTVDGFTTLFARTAHPSWQWFSYERWSPMLKAFLSVSATV